MINKKFFVGMAVLVLLFGFVLAGCASVKVVSEETETSRAIYDAASELVLSQGGRIQAGALVSGLAAKFPGLKTLPQGMSFVAGLVKVNYGGTAKWPTTYDIECTMEGIEESSPALGVTLYKAYENTIVTSITSVIELRAIEE
jgi:hypothetical protein